jgi:hypothetical protein
MHDWYLENIQISLAPNRVVLTFLVPGEELPRIVNTHFIEISLPQKNEWGPSVYVMEGVRKQKDGRDQLWLEMQSGDLIIINGVDSDINVR